MNERAPSLLRGAPSAVPGGGGRRGPQSIHTRTQVFLSHSRLDRREIRACFLFGGVNGFKTDDELKADLSCGGACEYRRPLGDGALDGIRAVLRASDRALGGAHSLYSHTKVKAFKTRPFQGRLSPPPIADRIKLTV